MASGQGLGAGDCMPLFWVVVGDQDSAGRLLGEVWECRSEMSKVPVC